MQIGDWPERAVVDDYDPEWRAKLVKCLTCGTRTLARVAERDWVKGRCELCTEEGPREVVMRVGRWRKGFVNAENTVET